MERIEPYNSESGESWKDYQLRQKAYYDTQMKQTTSENKKTYDREYQKKRREDTDYSARQSQVNKDYYAKNRDDINAKRREKYKKMKS